MLYLFSGDTLRLVGCLFKWRSKGFGFVRNYTLVSSHVLNVLNLVSSMLLFEKWNWPFLFRNEYLFH